eukprot:2042920-Amphidinium_carterae.1
MTGRSRGPRSQSVPSSASDLLQLWCTYQPLMLLTSPPWSLDLACQTLNHCPSGRKGTFPKSMQHGKLGRAEQLNGLRRSKADH